MSATRFYSVLPQVDGIIDTFELPEAFVLGSVVLAYNGQIYDPGQNIVAENPTAATPTVQLSFVPAIDTHTLMLIYKVIDDLSSGTARAQTFPPGGLLNDC